MKIFAVVNKTTGIVENTVLWDGKSNWQPPVGCEAVATTTAGIGWSYSEGKFTPPTDEESKNA